MNRNRLITALSVLIICIALLHILAMQYNLYFSIWWFDLPMHFLGGLWAGLFVLFYTMIYFARKGKTLSPRDVFFTALIGGLVVGALWEVYEYAFGFTFTTKSSYKLDTLLDLLMDVTGAAVGSVGVIFGGLSQKSITPNHE